MAGRHEAGGPSGPDHIAADIAVPRTNRLLRPDAAAGDVVSDDPDK
jgi:hypothetical protein